MPAGVSDAGFDAITFNLGYPRVYVMEPPRLAKIAFYPVWNTSWGERRIELRVVALE